MPKKTIELEPRIFTSEVPNFLWATFRPEKTCNLTAVKVAVENNKKRDPQVQFKVLHGTKVIAKEQPAHKKAAVKEKLQPGIDLSIGIKLYAELEEDQTVKVKVSLEIE